jgi:hypothetical protein
MTKFIFTYAVAEIEGLFVVRELCDAWPDEPMFFVADTLEEANQAIEDRRAHVAAHAERLFGTDNVRTAQELDDGRYVMHEAGHA